MAAEPGPLDLYVLVADKNMEQTLLGLLARPDALGIRALRYQVTPHPSRDPGCLREGAAF